MTYTVERIADLWDEAHALMAANAAESGAPGLTFRPNRTQYVALEQLGVMRCYTARTEAGQLAGYAVFLLTYHPQYAEQLAMQEVLYVAPEWRGIGAGRFLRWTDARLSEEHVGAVIRHTTAVDYGRSLQRLGYEPFQVAYLKRF